MRVASVHSVSEFVEAMYRLGYDFRHILAMSVAPMVEVLVRAVLLVQGLAEGRSLEEAAPVGLDQDLEAVLAWGREEVGGRPVVRRVREDEALG